MLFAKVFMSFVKAICDIRVQTHSASQTLTFPAGTGKFPQPF